MKILVANLGSTSFKYRLYDLGDGGRAAPGARRRSSGSARRTPRSRSSRPAARSSWSSRSPTTATPCRSASTSSPTPSSACSQNAADVAAIGFKAVHARNLTGVHQVDEDVLDAMEAFADVAPRTTRRTSRRCGCSRDRFPRLPAGRRLRDRLPPDDPRGQPALRDPRRVGDRPRRPPLGLPRRQPPLHRRPDGRAARPRRPQGHLLPPRRQLVALRDPRRASRWRRSMGMSPQSGLPQNNRVGDFDVFALPVILRETGPDAGRGPRHPGEQVGPRRASAARATTSATSRPRPRRATPQADAGPRRVHRLGPPLPRRLPRRARRGRRDRLHRRDRRELGPDPRRASAATSTGSASRSTRRGTPRGRPSARSRPTARGSRSGPSRRTRRSSSPGSRATCCISGRDSID